MLEWVRFDARSRSQSRPVCPGTDLAVTSAQYEWAQVGVGSRLWSRLRLFRDRHLESPLFRCGRGLTQGVTSGHGRVRR